VLAALGSTEKHGAHIPLGTDSHVTMEVVKRAAAAADVLYSPLVPFGYSPHHMGRHLKGAGSITLRAETYRRIMSDITRSLIFHGFKRIVFVSHHGSNIKPIDEVMRHLRYDTGAFISYYKTPTERDASVIQDLFDNPPEETPGWHSSELETSALMATSDCLVSMERAVEDRHTPRGTDRGVLEDRRHGDGEVPRLGEYLGADGASRILRHRGDRQSLPLQQGEGAADAGPDVGAPRGVCREEVRSSRSR
jgi:creatinine amidohydrolase/Fe(II)-dependent formamide hydrolase-like protein